MSLTNLQTGIRFDGVMTGFNQPELHMLIALKTPLFQNKVKLMTTEGPGGGSGYFQLAIDYGGYCFLFQQGDNYGAPLGALSVDPGYNLSASGRLNQWTWFWAHRDSLSARGFRVHNSTDFTVSGTFSQRETASYLQIGSGLPSTSKVAHAHFLSSFNAAQFSQVVAGTLNPATLPELIDGFTFGTDTNSVRGVLSASFYATPGVIDPSDNPVLSLGGGGGGGGQTGRRRLGFGW